MPAPANNVACMNAYDHSNVIPVQYQTGLSQDTLVHQHAYHCFAFECLRGWLKWSVAAYNAIGEPEPWATVQAEIRAGALARCVLNPASAEHANQLTETDMETAAALAISYYEQGYPNVDIGGGASSKRNFERDSGVSAN